MITWSCQNIIKGLLIFPHAVMCTMCMHVHYYVLTSIVLQMGCKKGKSWSSTFGLHFASLGHKEFKIGLLQSLILLHLLLIVSIHCLYWLQWDWMLNSEPETQFKLCWQILSHYVVRNWPAKNSKALRIVKVTKIQSVYDFIDWSIHRLYWLQWAWMLNFSEPEAQSKVTKIQSVISIYFCLSGKKET